ncbi:hypothetical protein [Dactylosporangium sp. CA-139066]|uniref:hypothetical protein n=1 Tax=Dactylosporangium sp. CA-139066 TaxID=3239930 RepID=UPI003D925747
MTTRSFRELAEMEQLVEDAAPGGWQFTPVAGPVSEIPPPDAPHVVIRAVAVPFVVDERARQVAAERGVDVEVVLAEWVAASEQ